MSAGHSHDAAVVRHGLMMPKFKRLNPSRILAAVAASALAMVAGPACAQPAGQSFGSYLQTVASHARAQGVSDRTIASVLSPLTPNPRVIELDGGQPSRRSTPPPLAPYLERHVDSARISRGRERFSQVQGMLGPIERRYGVPGKMMLAIWGHETNYGSYMGDFDLARSLATLAWEGRRRDLFEGELIALLKMVDRGVPQSRLKGSWAGAFGNPQFLPSVYLRLAADGDGDGDADIWSSYADTLASIANYFRQAGWRPGQPWGVLASVPSGFNVSRYDAKLASPSCSAVHERHSQWKPVSEWRSLGITPLAPIGDDVMASLFQPDGPGTRAWLLTGNYRVILQYNCSNYYAMSVGLLADEIAR